MSKKSSMFFVLALVVLFVAACTGKSKKSVENLTASGIEISIKGMTCTGCEQSIKANISKLEGVKSVKASFVAGKALVEYIPSLVDTSKMREAVTGAGYAVNEFTAVPLSEAPQE